MDIAARWAYSVRLAEADLIGKFASTLRTILEHSADRRPRRASPITSATADTSRLSPATTSSRGKGSSAANACKSPSGAGACVGIGASATLVDGGLGEAVAVALAALRAVVCIGGAAALSVVAAGTVGSRRPAAEDSGARVGGSVAVAVICADRAGPLSDQRRGGGCLRSRGCCCSALHKFRREIRQRRLGGKRRLFRRRGRYAPGARFGGSGQPGCGLVVCLARSGLRISACQERRWRR